MPADDLAAAAFDALPLRAAVIGPSGTVLRVNEAWRGASVTSDQQFWAAPGAPWPPDEPDDLASSTNDVLERRRERADLEVSRPAGGRARRLRVRIRRLAGDAGLVVTVDDVTAGHQQEEALRHAASHDPLTGLPNRRLLGDRLAEALTRGHASRDTHTLAVLFLDLDGFAHVNNTFGYATGDAVLRAASIRIATALRPDDLLARWGGDEFIVLAGSITSPEAMGLAEDITAALGEPLTVGTRQIKVAVSVGVALSASPGPAGTPGSASPSGSAGTPGPSGAAVALEAGRLIEAASDALVRSRARRRRQRRP